LLLDQVGAQPPKYEETPLERVNREFHANNWATARDGLLAKCKSLRVIPEYSPVPRAFRYVFDRRYKRRSADGTITLSPGPISGQIVYHHSPFQFDGPPVIVTVDDELEFFHPNYSRARGVLCLGHLPPGPFPLEALLIHLYGILTYQNWRSFDPLDEEAARYFALDPSAMHGLNPVDPLY
jgi:hypothetical protein